jgi:CO/xanthine dehydrogenase Mo-binding subunit
MRHALDRAYVPKTAGLTATDSRRGDLERALREAALVIDRHYATATNNHHPIEPHCVIASWDADGLTVRTASQAIFSHRRVLAACFGLPPERVKVISPFLGGGFGAKGGAWTPCLVLAAMVARHVDAPVALELTRAQMFTLTGRRQETMQRLRLGATRDGQLTAIDHATVAQTSVYGEYADPVGSVSRMLYACPNVATRHRLVRVNAPQPNPARAPGEGPGSFALETALDELAADLALDPLELRAPQFRRARPARRSALVEQWPARMLADRSAGIRVGRTLARARQPARRTRGDRLGHGVGMLSRLPRRLRGRGRDRSRRPDHGALAARRISAPGHARCWPSLPRRRWACRSNASRSSSAIHVYRRVRPRPVPGRPRVSHRRWKRQRGRCACSLRPASAPDRSPAQQKRDQPRPNPIAPTASVPYSSR